MVGNMQIVQNLRLEGNYTYLYTKKAHEWRLVKLPLLKPRSEVTISDRELDWTFLETN